MPRPASAPIPFASIPALPASREYQVEMLELSIRQNIIISMDTGSGKTHIAVLRIRYQVERDPIKISWFLAPTVALCEQQYDVIKGALPVSVGLISGSLEPNQWKDAALWTKVLSTHRVLVSTPQVLLDALRHSYLNLSKHIGLLVFDEAHHGRDKHPYAMIMQEFYFSDPYFRPAILGLTASPIYGGDNVAKAFRVIESNLDSTIRTPRLNREELEKHVHRPVFKHSVYIQPRPQTPDEPFSTNLQALRDTLSTLTIDEDPYVVQLRQELAKITPQTPEYIRVDQKLSKVIRKENSFTLKGLKDFERAADAILWDLGEWATDWYVWTVLRHAKAACHSQSEMPTWQSREKRHLASILEKIQATEPSYCEDDILCSSNKVAALVQSLHNEKEDIEEQNEAFSGLIFVQRRDSVIALTELLIHHPVTSGSFHIGSLVGTSDSSSRHSLLDITRKLIRQSQEETLSSFRLGEKNLLIATAVAEEGIDVQACGCVIRWDAPQNMVSWLQSRGRARRKRSTFIMMFPEGSGISESVTEWERTADEIVRQANADRRLELPLEPEIKENREFREPTTGALLTLESAIQHLAYFVAVHPNAGHQPEFKPLYDLDPPELPIGWHSFNNRQLIATPYAGPFGASVTLPRFLPANLRVHATSREHPTKSSAQKHAAFNAYRKLYDVGLLDKRLLPLFSNDQDVEDLKKDVEKRVNLVKVAPQINPWLPLDQEESWHRCELCIGSLPPLHMFTRRPCPPDWLNPGGPPPLYVPRIGVMNTFVRELGSVEDGDTLIHQAREYTRRLFWSVHGVRMEWQNVDFSYLFLPTVEDPWDDRREWLREELERNGSDVNSFDAHAEHFARTFFYPTDISIVKNRWARGKSYKFVSWRYGMLSEDEFDDLQERYGYFEDFDSPEDVPYPLIVVEGLPVRTNLLLPFAPPRKEPALPPKQFVLMLKHSFITLLSEVEMHYVNVLPSLMRALGIALTTQSIRDELFTPASPLYDLPSSLLAEAITTPLSQESYNYQRLETLGDTVLKYIVSIQLLSEYPLWHEGYLSKRKDHAVSNVRLAKENISRNMFKWIIRDRLLSKKWKPAYQEIPKILTEPSTPQAKEVPVVLDISKTSAKLKRQRKMNGQLSTKVLADIIESTIGAAYLHGGIDLGYECNKFFDLGIPWKPLPERISSLLDDVKTKEAESRLDFPLSVMSNVESMLDYTFNHKLILLEALSHASHQQHDFGTTSYERMEFLGDAVMDMIVTDYLYRAEGKNYSPGHMHLRKSACVNMHILAYLCLRAELKVQSFMPRPSQAGHKDTTIEIQREETVVQLWKCLLHSSSRVLDQQRLSFDLFKKLHEEIEEALTNGKIYPWAALTKLQAPKFLSDMIESLLGAVYLDSNGDLDAARGVLWKLGLLPLLERIVKDDVDVLHPVSRLSVWASRKQKKVEYVYERSKGQISCLVKLGDEFLEDVKESDVYRGKVTETEVKFVAAEKAIKFLHVKYDM